jgi:serine/threonine protein kinase
MSLINSDTHVAPQILLQPHPAIDVPHQDGGHVPPPIQVKSDGEAHAAQQKLIDTLKKDFNVRDIQRGDVLTGAGLKDIIGSASRYAKVKDTMMRASHRIFNRLKPDASFGSNHKAAIRLARQYENLKNNGAPENELRDALNQLKEKLETMHARRSVDAELRTGEPLTNSPMKALTEYIDHEIATFPSSHLEKAEELATKYRDLKRNGSEINAKIRVLEQLIDHLKGADPNGTNEAIQGTRKRIEEELEPLKTHKPLKDDIEAFAYQKAKGEKVLNHVHTRVQDPMDVLRYEAQQARIHADPMQDLERTLVNLDILLFDKGSLNHVETEERTGLEHAQGVYMIDSLLDDQVINNPKPIQQGKAEQVSEPGINDVLDMLDTPEFGTMGMRLSNALRMKDDNLVTELSKELGELMARDFSDLGKDRQLALATTNGGQMMEELFATLVNQDGVDRKHLSGSYKDATPALKSFLEKALLTATTNLPDRQVDEKTLVIDGVTFTKGEKLGEGGYAKVFLYEGERNGEAVKIAVKEALSPSPEEFEATAKEARIHFAATRPGNDNAIQFHGAIRTQTGGVLIAMELAPGGQLHNVGKKIQKDLDTGLISLHAANLMRITLIKDMARGLQHLHESAGMTHFDLKPVNYFMGSDGKAKLGDFGLTDANFEKTFDDRATENPRYSPPEAITGFATHKGNNTILREVLRRLDTVTKNIEAKDFSQTSSTLEGLNKNLANFKLLNAGGDAYPVAYESLEKQIQDIIALGKESPQNIEKLSEQCQKLQDEMRPVFKAHQDTHKATPLSFSLNEKTDTWALGISAFELATGESFYETGFASGVEEALFRYAKDPESRFDTSDLREKGGPRSGVTGGSQTGAGGLTRLLNQLLQPNPDDRPTLSDVLSYGIMDQAGVDSEPVRNLIKLMGDPNATPEQLKQASNAIGQ